MVSAPTSLSAGLVTPWSKYPLEITTPKDRYLASNSASGGLTEESLKYVGPPLPRVYHSSPMVSCSSGDIFVFGGMAGTHPKNDTWAIRSSGDPTNIYIGVTANLLETTGEAPSPRIGAISALADGLLVLWGGATFNSQKEFERSDSCTYSLNITTHQWTKLDIQPAPDARAAHAGCLCDTKFVVFGGTGINSTWDDLWSLDLYSLAQGSPSWERIEVAPGSPSPLERFGHTMVAYENSFYIFGGKHCKDTTFDDTWRFDMATRAWTELECADDIPPPCSGHAAALVGDVMYICGGRGEDGEDLGDVWSFKISGMVASVYHHKSAQLSGETEQRWYKFPSMNFEPSIRSGHILATNKGRVFVVGGWKNNRHLSEIKPFIHVLDTDLVNYSEHAGKKTIQFTPRIKQSDSTGIADTSEGDEHIGEGLSKNTIGAAKDLASGVLEAKNVESETNNARINELTAGIDSLGSDTLGNRSENMDTETGQEVAGLITRDIISGAMSTTEILRHLVAHGCHDISQNLDFLHIPDYPISHGGYGDVYCATLRNGDRVHGDLKPAPELIKEETQATQASDIYALGMVIFEVVTRTMPYAGAKDPAIVFNVVAGKIPARLETHIPTGIKQADSLWSLLTRCWAYDPSERPKAWEVRNVMTSITPQDLLSPAVQLEPGVDL